ncbi:hypothetical protein MuYL_0628 [Mucilaginibacter xinganensis]|uniref:Uncharacterized protein n=1 Tax=Mucilaginibacter xinganensis TaxID=1234841 RepID=A0A223NSN8_9SPHI|nr:hypothetical protein MuYL_0628 [Mucilaginibacter xinganensis]
MKTRFGTVKNRSSLNFVGLLILDTLGKGKPGAIIIKIQPDSIYINGSE